MSKMTEGTGANINKKLSWIERCALIGIILIGAYELGVMSAGEYYRKNLVNYRDSLVVERNLVLENIKTFGQDAPSIKPRFLLAKKDRLDSLINVTNNKINYPLEIFIKGLKSWFYLFE